VRCIRGQYAIPFGGWLGCGRGVLAYGINGRHCCEVWAIKEEVLAGSGSRATDAGGRFFAGVRV
jgi:hypothetical protein